MNWLKIVAMILGEAEQIVPIFIHNPQSQKIEGIVVTTAHAALSSLTPPATPAP